MPISVEVMARMLRQPNETEQEGIARACTELAKSFLDSKASEECVSCIKAVEYVRLEGLSSIKKCAICYQDYYAGTVVDCLPCSHVYHANCLMYIMRTVSLANLQEKPISVSVVMGPIEIAIFP
ncbi:hypothetical protein RHGRI_021081 [Rhododendron griersonianum]|uniref:RING-type domain-containing protein n=1 Tax=Rhododendron griersonianum TaxID=479676 RepID=A0AAV6JIU7_9ERIC|nr:hypothetical protein RHGRI_021081 [Rhododendron griersonianum]